MSVVSKEGYERKQQYAENKMKLNEEIAIENGLNEEQIEVIEDLCRIRHEMHCNQKDFFASESYNFNIFWDYVDSDNENSIYLKLVEVNLPEIDFSSIDLLCENDSDYLDYDNDLEEYDEDSEEYEERKQELYDEAYDRVIVEAEKINKIIENYLFEIDKKYNTNYCPTGLSRI